MQITRVKCPEEKYAIKCPDVTVKEGITIHNTYNDASAMSEISYMIGRPEKVSFHAAVDDYRVVEGLPFDRSCYAAGDGRYGFGNAKTINIEICYSKSGGERFDQAERLAAEYIALLLKQYGWGIEKVTKHQDYSGKYCPHRTLDYGWERFLNIIREYLDIQPTPAPTPSENHVYKNGSTSEIIYADTNCTKRIGSLNPWEQCYCYGVFNNRALVRYEVGLSGNYKVGFAKWVNGAKGDKDVNISNVFKNGKTTEPVYANTDCSLKIGSLNKWEQCDCLGIFNDRPVVLYQVGNTGNYKVGFAVDTRCVK